MNLPVLDARAEIGVFLDFDGTLVEIEERPGDVKLAETTRWTLTQLCAATGGAVAIVSGRSIGSIDALLAPLKLAVAGEHGLTRRSADGSMHKASSIAGFLDHAESALSPLVRDRPGLLLERKSVAIALHYRSRPDAEAACLAAMQDLASSTPGIQIMRGKMVLEAKPAGADKGTAIADFMMEAPFKGRWPMFAGDDVTDEDAFAMVNAINGITIKIGIGPTDAQWRAPGTATFLNWLGDTAARLGKEHASD